MTNIVYFAREFIDNNVISTVKFETTAQITKNLNELMISYQEPLEDRACCNIYYNGNSLIEIIRVSGNLRNKFKIIKGKFVSNNYNTLSGVTELSTFGNEISVTSLKNQTQVLKFNYNLYQNYDLVNSHQIYLQIKE